MSNRPTTRPYDQIDVADEMRPKQLLMPLEGAATMTGTHAAAGTSIATLFKVPANTNITVTGATMQRTTGGTAAATAPAWGLMKSLAGTGAVAAFGTLLFGTVADASWSNFSVTSTNLAAGDVVSLYALTGTTTEESQVGTLLCIEYEEDWS